MFKLNFIGLFLLIALLGGCVQAQPSVTETFENSTACKDPRPQMCTREYQPVCAKKDTGIRCIKAPCPSIQRVTYANDCTACSDLNIASFKAGACAKPLN
jgi:hypothetical protein